MGRYNVIEPCVVNGLHYARPTAQPIEVDDDKAAPLVEAGSLTPYQPGGIDSIKRTEPDLSGDVAGPLLSEHPEVSAEVDADRKPRRPRRDTED